MCVFILQIHLFNPMASSMVVRSHSTPNGSCFLFYCTNQSSLFAHVSACKGVTVGTSRQVDQIFDKGEWNAATSGTICYISVGRELSPHFCQERALSGNITLDQNIGPAPVIKCSVYYFGNSGISGRKVVQSKKSVPIIQEKTAKHCLMRHLNMEYGYLRAMKAFRIYNIASHRSCFMLISFPLSLGMGPLSFEPSCPCNLGDTYPLHSPYKDYKQRTVQRLLTLKAILQPIMKTDINANSFDVQ